MSALIFIRGVHVYTWRVEVLIVMIYFLRGLISFNICHLYFAVVFAMHCARLVTHPLESSSTELINTLEKSAPKLPDMTNMSSRNRLKVFKNFGKRKKAYDSKRKKTMDECVMKATMFRCPCEKPCLLNADH